MHAVTHDHVLYRTITTALRLARLSEHPEVPPSCRTSARNARPSFRKESREEDHDRPVSQPLVPRTSSKPDGMMHHKF